MVIGIDVDDTITKTSKCANKLLKNNDKYNYVIDYHDLNSDDYDEFMHSSYENED